MLCEACTSFCCSVSLKTSYKSGVLEVTGRLNFMGRFLIIHNFPYSLIFLYFSEIPQKVVILFDQNKSVTLNLFGSTASVSMISISSQ